MVSFGILIYLLFAIPVLLAVVSWRATGKAYTVYTLPIGRIFLLIFISLIIILIGLPLFLSGIACAVMTSMKGDWGREFLGVISIALSVVFIGFSILSSLWRGMKKIMKK